MTSRTKAAFDLIFVFGFLALLVGGTIFDLYTGYCNETNVTDTVISKDRIADDNDGYYLIYCQNETFQMTDATFKGKFNSSDDYKFIEPGQTYNFHVIGMRIPVNSHYRNILDYTKV